MPSLIQRMRVVSYVPVPEHIELAVQAEDDMEVKRNGDADSHISFDCPATKIFRFS